MKYNIRKTTRNTAILAFEAYHSAEYCTPEIKRYLPKMRDLVTTTTGDVLGLEEDKPCALIIEVRVHDLIVIRDTDPRTGDSRYTNIRIESNFVPVRLPIPDNCPPRTHHKKLLWINRTVDFTPQPKDQRLRGFFGRKHPQWLQGIVDRQLVQWRQEDPNSYYNCAPIPKVELDVHRLPELAPYAALARFKARLNAEQLATCMKKSPRGAVIHALDEIPQRDREDYLIDNANDALEFIAEKLTDQELGMVASIEMWTAFSRRDRMSGHRRAIMLASSYCISFLAGSKEPLPALQAEIRQSLLEYPAQWRAADTNGFPSILRGLQTYVKMGLDHNFILALMSKVDSEDRLELAGIVASMI